MAQHTRPELFQPTAAAVDLRCQAPTQGTILTPLPLAQDLSEDWACNMEQAEVGGGTKQLVVSWTQRLFQGPSILPSIFFLPVLQ